MLILFFALFDIVIGASLLLVEKMPAGLLLLIGVLVLIKGIVSAGGSALQKYFLDWMGWVDIIAGIILLAHFSVPIFWLLPIVKGTWSLLTGLLK